VPQQENKPTILVTGGAGYIGSHTCKELAQAGFTPVTFDNLENGHREAVKWGPLIEGDLSDKALIDSVMQEYSIKAVTHFAAFTQVAESMEDPGSYFRNNVTNTFNVLESMRDNNVNAIVFSSTGATYGKPESMPMDETHPQVPINAYGETKLFVEKALHWFSVAHDIRSVVLRFFNAAGDDADGEIGERHDPATNLIAIVIQVALGQRSHIDIYGTDYPTPDGTAIRDYVHVKDLADAFVCALEYLFDGGDSTAVNLGTGQGYSVCEVIDAVANCSGNDIKVREVPRRAGDTMELVADVRKAKEVLNWTPTSSSLEHIVETALKWHKYR
jgi:UDP-arabinose 4-epimerase